MAFTCITQLHEYAWQAHFHMHSNSTSTSSRRDSQMKRIIKLLENSNSECEELLGGHEIKISLGLKTCHDRDITRFYEQKSRGNTHTLTLSHLQVNDDYVKSHIQIPRQ